MKDKFSENLKQLRSDHKLSQKDLAQLLGVTQQCISEWELGKTEPTMTYLCIIADKFNISIDSLCGRKDY